MSNRYFYLWICILSLSTYLCQNFKSLWVIIISAACTAAYTVWVLIKIKMAYGKAQLPHRTLRFLYDIFALIAVSCSLTLTAIFCFDKSDGLQFLFISIHIIPLIPVIAHIVMLTNSTNNT